jgi:hypothetical protein
MELLTEVAAKNQGECAHRSAAAHARGKTTCIAISFIRTVTVGFGLTPNLLTPPQREPGQALAGSCDCSPSPPVGISAPP